MSAVSGFLHRQQTEFTEGMQKWDYLYSGDAARILVGLAEYGSSGAVYCVGSGKTALLKEYIHQIYRQVNGKDASDQELGIGMRPYMDKQVMHLQADVSEWPDELQKELEEKPMCSFEQGIQETVEWLKR